MQYDDDIMFTPDDGFGVQVRSTKDTHALAEAEMYEGDTPDFVDNIPLNSSLAQYVLNRFDTFSDAKENSGIEDELIASQLAYNGEYDASTLERIAPGQSSIFMNLTTTKCRAGMSWIKDILLPANAPRFTLKSTPVPNLPLNTLRQIEAYFNEELERGTQEIEAEDQQKVQQAAQAGQAQPGGAQRVQSAANKLRQINELKRSIEESLKEEIKTQADYELKAVECLIDDALVEGGWDDALDAFIADFCIYPTAFMKAPVISKKKRLTWVKGEPVVDKEYVFENKRVSPFDIYPDPGVDKLDDGDIIEHVRYTESQVEALRDIKGYSKERIDEVLENKTGIHKWLDSGIEFDKAELEKRGTEYEMNEKIFHGLHFHGAVSGRDLLDWGSTDSLIDKKDRNKMYQAEVLLIGDEVVKAVINDDPLHRKPYLCASFQKIPGSIWGRSIPNLMRDIQRMCNATARALADNMGLSSGPQVEVYIDRLADDGDITAMEPRKIWQLKSDPTGAGGRAIQWFTIPSNAQELLQVYQDFEMKADDATGIPRYAYGNERAAGAASTARGLAMLLESASKGIKDAIRNIDRGVIIPRVQYQFYWTVLTRKDIKYSGDIQVVPYGSEAILLKAAQEAKRLEFLQTTANPMDQKIMGWAGRADILREAAKDLGFPHNLIPNKIELQKLEKEERMMEQQRLQIESNKQGAGIEAVKIQAQSAEKIAQGNQQLKGVELEIESQALQAKHQAKLIELQERRESALAKSQQDMAKTYYKEEQQNIRTNKNLAVDLQRSKNSMEGYAQRSFA